MVNLCYYFKKAFQTLFNGMSELLPGEAFEIQGKYFPGLCFSKVILLILVIR